MEIAKALILAGRGCQDRPWPTAPAGPKHLFPIANRPILFHNLEALRSAGVLEAAILADSDSGSAIERAVGDGRELGLSVRHHVWNQAAGVGAALTAAHDFVGEEPVLVQQGDALLRDRMHPHIAAFARERLDALALRLAGASRSRTQVPEPGYLLSPRAVSILLEGDGRSPVAGIRSHGGRVRIQRVDGCLACHGDQDALLESNRRMLELITPSFEPASLGGTRVEGSVVVHPTARVHRSLLRGPLIIGPRAVVSDAYVGPYTSIGAGVVIEGAEIEHSIVLPDAQLRFLGTRLESSVIGREARVLRGFELPAVTRMSIGDRAEVILR